MSEIQGSSPYTIHQFVKAMDEGAWKRKIHRRLFEAGILDSPEPAHSPVTYVGLMHQTSIKGETTGEPVLRFTIAVASGMKKHIDAAFQPYNSSRIRNELTFTIPVKYFGE